MVLDMEVIKAIESRRTIKTFNQTPLERTQLERILSAARWAPNHRMTQPWRLRVIGPETLAKLVEFCGSAGKKLLTAPHLVLVSYVPSKLALHATEDEHSTAAAIYAILLAAHGEGLASYWRTPAFLRDPQARIIAGIPEDERTLGLVYLGRQQGSSPQAPHRKDLSEILTYLP